jgi:hypothetical protein
MLRACVAAVVLAVGVLSSLRPAHAYEFWLRATTVGQAYQLRSYRLLGPDVFHGRRRYTNTLALRIWDVGDFAATRRKNRLPDRGLRISWHSYLRIDHDFGDYASGRESLGGSVRRDALDLVPELGESVAGVQLLYGYLELAGIAGDRVNVQLGRTLTDEGWGTTAIDGGAVRFELPQPVAIIASAGLRVRAASIAGLSAYELDGTAGAGCREYVEAAMPGTGTWKLIDRNRPVVNARLSSDYEFCPQREVRQPTVGVTLATSRLRKFGAELGYRRTWSRTVGLIGPEDRLDFPDLGLYPNDFGQAPQSGVNEERLHTRVHGELAAAGLAIGPYANARFSVLHAAIDRADAGVRVTRGAHSVEPAVEYFLPTFDGDSIFNVFSIEPATDVRLGYRFDGAIRARASAWVRRYEQAGGLGSARAGGVDAGVEQIFGAWRGRLDALWDDGYGGRRVGGSGEAGWRPRDTLWLRGRLIVLGIAQEDHQKYVTASTVISTTWKLADAVAVHAIGELDRDAIHKTQGRGVVVLDLAFMPEP